MSKREWIIVLFALAIGWLVLPAVAAKVQRKA